MPRTENKEMRGIIGNSDIPYPRLRGDYSWVESNYLPDKKLEADQLRAEAELKEVIAMPPDMPTLRERVAASHDAYVQRNVETWARLLLRSVNVPDPLARIEKKMQSARLDFVPWEILEKALVVIEGQNIEGISDEKRSKRVSAIEKKIANIKEQRAAGMPEEAFDDNQYGKIGIFDVFVDFWRSLQEATADPVSPDGKSLSLSTPEEKAAWQALELGQVVSPKTRLAAWRPI